MKKAEICQKAKDSHPCVQETGSHISCLPCTECMGEKFSVLILISVLRFFVLYKVKGKEVIFNYGKVDVQYSEC